QRAPHRSFRTVINPARVTRTAPRDSRIQDTWCRTTVTWESMRRDRANWRNQAIALIWVASANASSNPSHSEPFSVYGIDLRFRRVEPVAPLVGSNFKPVANLIQTVIDCEKLVAVLTCVVDLRPCTDDSLQLLRFYAKPAVLLPVVDVGCCCPHASHH